MNTKKDVEILVNYILNRTYGKSLDSKLVINYDYFYPLLKAIKKELDRLEKLEKAIELFKRKMIIVKLRDNEYIIRGNEYITKEQYDLLKEVFTNE